MGGRKEVFDGTSGGSNMYRISDLAFLPSSGTLYGFEKNQPLLDALSCLYSALLNPCLILIWQSLYVELLLSLSSLSA